jgi:NAD(P)H-hydrate epimerase
MASGGMGDVLSGLIGGLVAQGYSLADSLRIAVCVHGASADLVAQNHGQRGMAATDLFPFVQQLVNTEC